MGIEELRPLIIASGVTGGIFLPPYNHLCLWIRWLFPSQGWEACLVGHVFQLNHRKWTTSKYHSDGSFWSLESMLEMACFRGSVLYLSRGLWFHGWLAMPCFVQGVVRVYLLEAENLVQKDSFLGAIRGKSDPYAILRVGVVQFRSRTISRDLNPIWNEVYEVPNPVVFWTRWS